VVDTLRIKRRTTGAAGAPGGLVNAELAYNEVDNTLYYGAGGNAGAAASILPIAGRGAYLPLTGGNLRGGIQFNSAVVQSPYDLSQHIELYPGYGFSITGSTLNYNSGIIHNWWIGNSNNVMTLQGSGLSVYVPLTVTGDAVMGNNYGAPSINASATFQNGGYKLSIITQTSGGAYTPITQTNDHLILGMGNSAVDTGTITIAPWSNYATGLRITSGASSSLTLYAKTITVSQDPTTTLGIATKQYVDTKAGAYLPLIGGTLTGTLAFGSSVNPDINKTSGTFRVTVPAFNVTSNSSVTLTSTTGFMTLNGQAGGVTINGATTIQSPTGNEYLYIDDNSGIQLLSIDGKTISIQGLYSSTYGLTIDASGNTFQGPTILSGDPTANLQAATKQYVDQKPSLTISDTAPVGPRPGAIWFDSVASQTYLWYNDPNSSQWVPLNAPPIFDSLPMTGGTLRGPLILYGDPTVALEAATKQYVDNKPAQPPLGGPYLPLTGGHVTGALQVDGTFTGGGYNRLNFTQFNSPNIPFTFVGNAANTRPLVADAGSVGSITWNYTAGGGEINFWNNFLGFVPSVSFNWYQSTSATAENQIATLGPNGLGLTHGIGVVYSGLTGGGNFVGFTWNAGAVQMFVDGANQGYIASQSYVSGNYLNLTGGSLTGGLHFGQAVAGNPWDTSRHITLFDNGYGFSITGGTLNIVTGQSLDAYSGTTLISRTDLANGFQVFQGNITASNNVYGWQLTSNSPNGGLGSGFLTKASYGFQDTTQPADAKIWDILYSGGNFYIRALTDDQSNFSAPLVFNRSGMTITGMSLTATNISLQGYVGLQYDPTSAMQAATKQYVDNKAAAIIISDTAPGAPTSGLIWFDSVGSQTYIRYTDPNSSQWVPLNTTAIPPSLPLTGGTLTGPLIINYAPTDTSAQLALIPPSGVNGVESHLRFHATFGTGIGDAGARYAASIRVGFSPNQAWGYEYLDIYINNGMNDANSDANQVRVARFTNGHVNIIGDVTASIGFSAGVTGNGSAFLNPGAGNNPGYIAFFDQTATRVGYIGWTTGDNRFVLQTENSYTGWSVNGTFTVGGKLTSNAGITLGAAVSGGPDDVSRHIQLWDGGGGTGYGFCVTNARLNYTIGGGATGTHVFRESGVDCFGINHSSVDSWVPVSFHSTLQVDLYQNIGNSGTNSYLNINGFNSSGGGPKLGLIWDGVQRAMLAGYSAANGGTYDSRTLLSGYDGLVFATLWADRFTIDSSGYGHFLNTFQITGAPQWSTNNLACGLDVKIVGANPAIGISDSSGINYIGICNSGGSFAVLAMPLPGDAASAPGAMFSVDRSGNAGVIAKLNMGGGISFGQRTAASSTDNTGHISLYDGWGGFNITGGNLNVVAGNALNMSFQGSSATMQVPLYLAADPTAAMVAATKQYVDNKTVTISDTAPGAPVTGQLWWDSVAGQLYLRFADANSSQWVATSNPSGASAMADMETVIASLTARIVALENANA
jgi:hypothetical protein